MKNAKLLVTGLLSFSIAGVGHAAAISTPTGIQYPDTIRQAQPLPQLPLVQVIGQAKTDQVTVILMDGADQCASVPPAYQADCLRQVFRTATSEMSSFSDYRPVVQELRMAERQINRLVRDNLDRNAPVVRVDGKRVRAVEQGSVSSVNARTRQIITESATRLIRSSGRAKYASHYTQIAQAYDSTKKILRS
ncbi:hypothetical protein [Thalassococcus sp. S3]|uniref:hypothetical protein n=1 Tax=Thalassococcus sp. S3 TaxID=2017482 RepID=UPI0010243278|nr:hypothetical protein [Thalassococcus sp. S3]QBF33846.1 hypothetical protein CFI11_21900 [Thalassococcus sp. S3]